MSSSDSGDQASARGMSLLLLIPYSRGFLVLGIARSPLIPPPPLLHATFVGVYTHCERKSLV